MALGAIAASRLLRLQRATALVPKPTAYLCARLHQAQEREIVFKSKYPDLPLSNLALHERVLQLSDGPTSQYGELLALKQGPKSLTYNMLKQQVLSVAEALQQQHHVVKGHVVAVAMFNCPEYAVAVHGAVAAGAVVTTVNPNCTAWELAHQLRDVKPRVMFTCTELLATVLEANQQAQRPIETIIVVEDEETGAQTGTHTPYSNLLGCSGAGWAPPRTNSKEDAAFVLYSSGTTGPPKGVVLTHFNMVNNLAQSGAPGVQLGQQGSRLLGVMPLYHAYGMFCFITGGMAWGVTVSLIKKFNPVSFLEILQEDKLELLHVAPPLALFLAKSPLVNQYDLSAVKEIFCSAAPLSLEVTTLLYQRFPSLQLVRQGYGMTELSPLTHADSRDKRLVAHGSGGLLVPNTMCKIVDLTTGQSVGPHRSGEVCIKGPQVMKGYLNNPTATANTIDSQGWLHTGDIGYVSDSGHLYIEDRIKELIKVKGHQVAPAELEALLLSHAAIADCCVVQRPDERAGELPKAFVVTKENSVLTAEEVMQWTNSKLTAYKHIVEVEFTSAIPRTPSGKILRRHLREQERKRHEDAARAEG